MEYREIIDYIESLPLSLAGYNLSRITKALAILSNPHECYKVVHIAGTNGKGSVAAMLDSTMRIMGLSVGRYTSPHIFTYTERVAVNGQDIAEGDFVDSILAVKKAFEAIEKYYGKPPTFEVLTAAALLYFAKQKVEWVVLETGLGGLLDSTNVVESEIAVITNVSFDHMERCGYSIKSIAEHKAGIIKQGAVVITAAEEEALEVIADRAYEKNAQLLVWKKDFCAKKVGELTEYQSCIDDFAVKYFVSLQGEYQTVNSSLVVTALRKIAEKHVPSLLPLLMTAIKAGLQKVSWPGRFEVIRNKEDELLIIDGAHNEAGAAALRKALDCKFSSYKTIFIFGALKDKKVSAIVAALWKENDEIVAVRVPSARALEAAEVAAVWHDENMSRKTDCNIYRKNSLTEALQFARDLLLKDRRSGKKTLICITGSLYMVGEAKKCVETGWCE